MQEFSIACSQGCPADAVCVDDVCVCASGFTACVDPVDGPVCVNVSTSEQYCGDCYTRCRAGAVCQNGVCGAS